MDIFGAFQFCSIAILAAPLTVRLSRTYFYDPGRNVIFLWTILILAGLIALCVEFYRVEASPCRYDNVGRALLGVNDFFNSNATCNLTCSETDGPFSPLRGGAASEIYIIPVPKRLTFNAAMLLAAGFCIPVSAHCFFAAPVRITRMILLHLSMLIRCKGNFESDLYLGQDPRNQLEETASRRESA
jgi:hypothetical protein